MIKLVYSLLCAAVLTYTAVFAGIGCTFLGQGNQSDILTKQAQSESVEVEIEPTVAAEPADGTATEEAAIEPELEVAEETTLELQAEVEIEPAAPAEPADETAAAETAIEPEPENTARSDACDEARKWYNEGLDLSDDSAREATYYQRAIELCPDFSAAHNRLGRIYKSRGEYESALKEFNQAQKWSLLNEPGIDQRGNRSLLVDHFIHKGEIYRMQGRYDLAAEQFNRALRINPDSRVAMNQLQYVNKMSGKYDNLLLPFIHLLSSPIFTQTPGMTLPKGVFVAGFMFRYWEQEATLAEDMFIGGVPEIPEWSGQGLPTRQFPFERTTTVMQTVLDLRYGLTDNFTIGLIPRWSTVWTAMAAFPGVTDKATGLADTNLLTKYQFWATRNTRISLYHLLSIPTGDENKVVWPGATIPLGSGSFNFRPGIAFTTKKEYLAAPLTIHSNISYRITNGEQVGDELRCDLAITYPFSPDINTTMELNYRWRDSYIHQQTFVTRRGDPIQGPMLFSSTIKEKSGQALFLSPGVQFTLYKDIRVNVGVQIPLIKPDGGWAERFVVNFGLKSVWNF